MPENQFGATIKTEHTEKSGTKDRGTKKSGAGITIGTPRSEQIARHLRKKRNLLKRVD
jgi:hypothetical protein